MQTPNHLKIVFINRSKKALDLEKQKRLEALGKRWTTNQAKRMLEQYKKPKK